MVNYSLEILTILVILEITLGDPTALDTTAIIELAVVMEVAMDRITDQVMTTQPDMVTVMVTQDTDLDLDLDILS